MRYFHFLTQLFSWHCSTFIGAFTIMAFTSPNLMAQEDGNQPAAQEDPAPISEFIYDNEQPRDYEWTTNHMHIGVRWQPYGGRPENNAYDAARPVISKYSSYAQFWVAWSASEPTEENTDYDNHMSEYLRTIEQSVDACIAEGLKCEFVFWHCPAWAAVGGKAGGVRAKDGLYSAFVERIARHFKGRVHAYQLAHEANLKMHLNDGDMDYMISEVFTKGAKAIRKVYGDEPVIISTSGCSPCFGCDTVDGLNATGGLAISRLTLSTSMSLTRMMATELWMAPTSPPCGATTTSRGASSMPTATGARQY